MNQSTSPTTLVLVPVKAFGRAKARLADSLPADRRANLARTMAGIVLDAADPLGAVVVCEDTEVADWARARGAAVAWTPGLDLNGALTTAVARAGEAGVQRTVIAHADLPFASDLARFADVPHDRVVIVGDRHARGTNVMSLPTAPPMGLRYGSGSRAAHVNAAREAGLQPVLVDDEALAWDVDEPADLRPPPHLGPLPGLVEKGGAHVPGDPAPMSEAPR